MAIYRRKVFVVPPPQAPPPLHNQSGVDRQNHYLPSVVILVSCVLGSAFLLLVCVACVNLYYSCLNNYRRREPPAFDDDHEDFFADENHGPVLDHPIWYINTVGLQQSVIDSIGVFQYKKDDGLIEGTDCSVCLSEFEEDETLRLLPKCSHAFHVPCIDTWLRSHKNCPLCRAPIVCDNAQVNAAEPILNDLGLREATRVENLVDYGGLGSHQAGEDGNNEMGGVGAECFGGLPIENGTNSDILSKNSCRFNRNCESRVLSDLADRRQKVEEELQPVRRSISMDASSASSIYLAVANRSQVKLEGCSSTQLVQVKKTNSEMVAKLVNRNSSIYRLMKSSSFGPSLQKGPVAMKRSFSSSPKFSLLRIYSRSQDSILPL